MLVFRIVGALKYDINRGVSRWDDDAALTQRMGDGGPGVGVADIDPVWKKCGIERFCKYTGRDG
jgi:hypothetical protein